MIRFLRAFSWLRWRLLVNGLKGGQRRDALEQVSRVVALFVPALLAVTTVSSILTASVFGFLAGKGYYGDNVPRIEIMMRVVLVLATIMSVLIPLFIGVRGGAARWSRLLLLPISRRTLHFTEVLSGLTDPWMVFVLPGLMAFGLGLIVRNATHLTVNVPGLPGFQEVPANAVMALVGGVALALLLSSLGSLVSFGVGWLVRDRRRSEVFVLVLVLGISALSILPPLLTARFMRQTRDRGDVAAAEALPDRLPAWTAALPSELYGQSIHLSSSQIQGRVIWWPRKDWEPIGWLLLETLVLYGLSAAIHKRLVGSVEGGRGHRRRSLPGERKVWKIPGLNPIASTIAMTQTRTALRSVRGRLVVLLPGPLVAALAVLLPNDPDAGGLTQTIAANQHLTLGVGLLFGLYAAQAFTMNQFGSDRAGLTLQFLSPATDVDLVRGKAVGCAIVFGLGALLSSICAVAATPGGSPFAWAATLLGGIATFFVISPVAAWFSAFFPVASDLSKTGSGGNPHSIAMIAGTILVVGAAVPAILILTLLSPRVALPVMAWWLVLAAAISSPLLRVAAGAVNMRRENLALVAQGR